MKIFTYLSFLSTALVIKILLHGLFLGLALPSLAQDRIYTTDGSFQEGSITRIDNDIIEYKITSGNSQLNQRMQSLQALAVFFPNGQFEVFPFTEPEILAYKSLPNLSYDVLITSFGEILQGKVISLENNQVKFEEKGRGGEITLDYSELLLGVYANGKHAMFRDPAQSLKLLKHVGKELKLISAQPTDFSDQKPIGSPKIDKKPAGNSSQEILPVPVDVESGTDELSGIDFEEFKDKALQKIDDLGSFISIISNKSTFPDQANQAIELAIGLFVDEDATVEVTTVGYTESFRRKIRDYLTRLKLLKYDRVEVKWADLNYVSNFRKGPDGNYYGTVSLKQTFDGFMDNKLVYSDVTEKQVEIVLKSLNKSMEGNEQVVWDVLLSDIGVLDTKSVK